MHKAVADALALAIAPSRELDAAVWLACFEPDCKRYEVEFHTEQYDNLMSRTAIECDLGSIWVDQMDPPLHQFTASTDAAVALVTRLRPEFFWRVQKQFGDCSGLFWAACGPSGTPKSQGTALGVTPAIALTSALMVALAMGIQKANADG